MPLLDPHQPFDDQTSRAQIDSLLRLAGDQPRRILDLGCGTCRTLLPLARAGHHVVGIDRDSTALDGCADAAAQDGLLCRRLTTLTAGGAANISAASGGITLVQGDFLDVVVQSNTGPGFDLICVLGNTFLTITDVNAGVALLRRTAACLTPTGVIALDNFPADIWAEVADGNWQQGISEDGSMQMIWPAGDTIVAFRTGEAVDPESWSISDRDTPLRLWTYGELNLAAQCAGLSPPHVDAAAHLIELRARGTA